MDTEKKPEFEEVPEDAFPKGAVTVPGGAVVQVEAQRAIAEVQGAIISAKKFPRDQFTAIKKIRESCKRLSLAEKALYQYDRGGKMITGPSIRLAEVLAQNWGNLDAGVRELGRREGVSDAESYAWDLETNNRQTRTFQVPHIRYSKQWGMKKLTDPRDIYETVANMGARRLRACIMAVIPGDVQDIAVEEVKNTIARGDGKPLIDRVRHMVEEFAKLGVPKKLMEKRLGHDLEDTTVNELVDLIAIYRTLKDGQAHASRFFDVPAAATEGKKAAELNAKLQENEAAEAAKEESK